MIFNILLDELYPIVIELADYVDWSIMGRPRIRPESKAAVLLAILLKIIYPIVSPTERRIKELGNAPIETMEFTSNEASILFYLQNLPTFREWIDSIDDNTPTKDLFKQFFKNAEWEVSSMASGAFKKSTFLKHVISLSILIYFLIAKKLIGLIQKTFEVKNLSVKDVYEEEEYDDLDSFWKKDLLRLYGPSTYPIYAKSAKISESLENMHEPLLKIYKVFCSELHIKEKKFASHVNDLESKILSCFPELEPKIPKSLYSTKNKILVSK